ncbi:MAG: hypothetical protein JRH10_11700 [Deltaproteobacteria bacterium]|nr:hypothetical protein [Deltaproteobacteria bacterium]MBW2444508.1 hypothetical protein [Deltaproteobacteria bacterium]
MHFFRARAAAESWRGEREGIALLSVADAFELAREHWVERLDGAEARRRA